MGILSLLFGGESKASTSKDNFEFVAKNIAQINYILRNRFATLDQILLIIGVMDLLAYLAGGVSFEDIKHALFHARRGKYRISFVEEQHEQDASDFEWNPGIRKLKDLLLNTYGLSNRKLKYIGAHL